MSNTIDYANYMGAQNRTKKDIAQFAANIDKQAKLLYESNIKEMKHQNVLKSDLSLSDVQRKESLYSYQNSELNQSMRPPSLPQFKKFYSNYQTDLEKSSPDFFTLNSSDLNKTIRKSTIKSN